MPQAIVFRFPHNSEIWLAIRPSGAIAVRLGRGFECDLALPEGVPEAWTVSRIHARFFKLGDNYWVEDLGSRNFTYINNRIILSPCSVVMPFTIRLGKVEVEVCIENLTSRQLATTHKRQNSMLSRDQVKTRAMDHLDLPNLVSRDTVTQVISQLRLAEAMQFAIQSLVLSRRVEEAESRLCLALDIYLKLKCRLLRLDEPLDSIEKELESLSLTLYSKSVLQHGALFDEYNTDASFKNCVSHRTDSRTIWLARPPADRPQRGSILVAESTGLPVNVEWEQLDEAIKNVLSIATPFASALRELEVRRANVRESAEFAPKRETLELCEQVGFWGQSTAFLQSVYEAERAAKSYLNDGDGRLSAILLLGESGVGKSQLARIIHTLSSHQKGPFVTVNCAAIPETLAESELFGHEKGAFTGAALKKDGLFERAHNGTLFLDEIGVMGSGIQGKLLTVLDTGKFCRVGGINESRTNCFLILATNEDPNALRREKLMREDLLYRIETLTIMLPPLRDRPEDIELIANKIVQSLNLQNEGRCERYLTPDTLRFLKGYSWPGNIRELTESVKAAYRLCSAERKHIDIIDLPPRIRALAGEASRPPNSGELRVDVSQPLDSNVQSLEREYLVRLLRATNGVKARAAVLAQISPQTLYTKLAAFHVWLREPGGDKNTEVGRLKELAGSLWESIFEGGDSPNPGRKDK